MKNEILDSPILDTFDQILENDEKIIWTGFSAEFKSSFYNKSKDGTSSFHLGKFFVKILDIGIEFLAATAVGVTYVAFHWWLEPENRQFWTAAIVFMFLPLIFSFYKKVKRSNQYAITSKRVLFQFARLPKEEIYSISFSEISNCIVTLDNDNYGVLYLATQNPDNLPDQLFEEGRHSPTFERIENPEEVATLIRNSIKNVNKLL